MNKLAWMACLVGAAGLWSAARADDRPGAAGGGVLEGCQVCLQKEERKRGPKAESSVTQHPLAAGGKGFDYTATAGTLVIRDNDDKPMANMSYVAYTRRDVKD